MGLYTSIPLERPIEFVNAEPLVGNPMISRVRVKIAYHGQNRNGSYISKDVLTNMAARSLPLTPIVGRFVAENNDFADHSIETLVTPEGDYGRVRYTKVYGVVPENPNATWEWFLDHDGVEREYLVCDGYLLTGRYPETLRIIEEGNNNQSMEIDPATVVGSWSQVPNSTEMSFVITEANFLGLCILGADIEPCFEGASFSANFSNENSSTLYEVLEREEQAKQKEVRNFMKELEYALNHDPSVVGVEKMDNEETKLGIAEAITGLDIAADTEPNPASVQAIDEAIDTLLTVETQLDREDVIVPKTEDAAEALEDMAGDATDIASAPNFDKAIPITKLSEEETRMNPEEILNQAEKPAVPPVAPAVQPQVDPAAVQPPVAPAPRVPVDEKRAQMAAAGQEPSVAEKLQDVLRAMQEMEQLKAALQEMATSLGGPVEAPAVPGEPVQEPEKKEGDEDKAEAPKEEAPKKEEAGEEKPANEVAVDPEEEKKKKAPVFASDDDDEKKKEAIKSDAGDITVEKDDDDDDDKKKKEYAEDLGDISQPRKEEGASKATGATISMPTEPLAAKKGEMASTTPDVKQGEMAPVEPDVKKQSNIVSYEKLERHAESLERELEFMRAENKALKAFKSQVELERKEAVLAEFSFLPQEEVAKLRLDFSNMTVEDLEAKCALIAYRTGTHGQKATVSDDIVSYSHEGANAVPTEDLEIFKAMSQISKRK